MKYIYFIAIILSIFKPSPAPAEMPDGDSDPAFQDAVEIWLSDDDATSLPALSRLAQDGNRAAQILLGQIEWHETAPPPWVAALDREQRRAIFRAPGGKFGKTWLTVAAEDSELARTILAARSSAQMVAAIPTLRAYGESRILGSIIKHLGVGYKWQKLVELEAKGQIPPERLYIVWGIVWNRKDATANRLRQDGLTAARNGSVQGTMFLAQSSRILTSPDPATLEVALRQARWFAYGGRYNEALPEIDEDSGHWFLEADETRQLAFACRALCPAQPGSCASAAWTILGGYTNYLDLGSPVATLIATNRYVRSKRAAGELLRRLAFKFEQGPYYRSMAASSLCLSNHLSTVTLR